MSDRRVRVVQRSSATDEDEVCALLDQSIEVVLPRGTPAWRHQVLALALVDLLGRLFPRIRVVCNPSAHAHLDLPPGASSLAERLQDARAHGETPEEPVGCDVRIVIGDSTEAADIYLDGAEWQSYVGTRPSRLVGDDAAALPVGPLVAACRGAAQVVGRVFGDGLSRSHIIESSYWSALTFHHSSEPLEEQAPEAPHYLKALLVGAGSIGGAATYLLARVPGLQGELNVVDPQAFEAHNPDRALLATQALAEKEAVKVEVVKDALAHLVDFDVRATRSTLAGLLAQSPREATLPLVLSAVDSVASRREIQDSLPLDLIDAACSPDEVSISGHRTDDGPCIYCLHVGNVLARDAIHLRLLEKATGFNERFILGLLHTKTLLTDQHLRQIEQHRSIPLGSLADHTGKTLEALYRDALLYGEMAVRTSGGGQAAVAAPFITALAGFLLAAEGLKNGAGEAYRPYRLGALGELPTLYRESLYGSIPRIALWLARIRTANGG